MNGGGYRITDQYGTYFMTFTVVGWVDLFTRRQCCQILLDSFNYCKENKGLILYAYVIMGSHLHLLASAAYDSKGISAIVRDYKTFTSKKIIEWFTDNRKESRRAWLDIIFKYYGKYNSNNNVYQVWQQHNKPMLCLTPEFTLQKLNYIHNNPVVAGLVEKPEDYLYSSAKDYLMSKNCGLLEISFL